MIALLFALIPTFIPPQEWNYQPIVNQSNNTKLITCFVAPKTFNSFFVPRITLSICPIDEKPDAWLNGAMEIHNSARATKCDSLGTTEGKCGTLHLLHIDKKHEANDLTILQAVHFRHKKAYILTASMLTNEAADHYHNLLNTFRSLNLVDQLTDVIEEDSLRKRVVESKDLKKILVDECGHYGPYFTLQMLTESR